ncbi:S-protein homolog 5 [Manihot esculenta]|uniref:S-protein homolog 5 n=1 Tax=Manihot esculenta TaxID=3983 RepID=UPI000B5D1966|nr:S-protein homolog 5 [Manihot esculenta]
MWAKITLLMLVMSSAVGVIGLPYTQIRTVNITNNLGANIELNVHCKSKNDDLGQQQIPYKDFWYFKFRPNFWGTTLFYCSMNWEQISHWFNIYVDARDNPKCIICQWSIQAKVFSIYGSN